MVEQSGEIVTKALCHLTFISPLDTLPLVEVFEEKRFPAGSTAFRHGDLSTSFSVVAAGELTLTVPSEPNRFLLRSGDYFGQWSLLVPSRHRGEGVVTSQEDLTLLTLEGETFRQFLTNLQPNYPQVEHYTYSEVIKLRAGRQFTPEEFDQRSKMMAIVDQVRLFQGLTSAGKAIS